MLLPDTTLACIFRVHIFEMIRQLLTDTIRYCDTFVCYFRQVWVLSVHRIQNRVSVHDAVQPNSEDKRRTEDVSFWTHYLLIIWQGIIQEARSEFSVNCLPFSVLFINLYRVLSFFLCYFSFFYTHTYIQAAKGRWCSAAGKVTVGLASHWPCVTDFSGLSTYGLTATKRDMSTPPMLQPWGMVHFTFFLHKYIREFVTHSTVKHSLNHRQIIMYSFHVK